MNGLRRTLIGSVGALLAAACAMLSSTPFTEAPIAAGQARLYVYRPESPVTPAEFNRVWLDGRSLAALDSNGYVTLTLPPGPHRLDTGTEPPDLASASGSHTIELHAGRATYCILFGVPSIYGGRWDARCSDDPEDHPDLRACRLRPLAPEGNWQP